MSDSRDPDDQGFSVQPPAAARAKGRPSAADVFGDVLPDVTSDERTPEPGELTDAWYQDNRPPHHDRG